MAGLPRATTPTSAVGLPKPGDDEDQVSRTPRARRAKTAKKYEVGSREYDLYSNASTAGPTRDMTADDLENESMTAVKKLDR